MRTATLALVLAFAGRPPPSGTRRVRRRSRMPRPFRCAAVLRAEPAAVRGRRHIRQRLRRDARAVLGRRRAGRRSGRTASTPRQASRGSLARTASSSASGCSSAAAQVFRLGHSAAVDDQALESGRRVPIPLSPRIIPYAGAGFASYHYTEESDFATPDENLDTDGTGVVVQAGVEVRAHRWVGIVAGLERTRVTGILGNGGLSQLYTSGELQEGATARTISAARPCSSESSIGGEQLR